MAEASSTVTVRALKSEDLEQWLALWDGYLSFYRERLTPQMTRHSFERLSGGDPQMHGLVAVVDGRLGGLAHLVIHPKTWSAAPDCYLEDLFVAAAHRGGATSKALIDATYARAREQGCDRVYWRTQQFNGRARSFYDQVGQLTSSVIYEHELD